MSAHDRYALAIALLDGDREARKILADLLEEQGDRGLAQWARGGGNAKHRRLEFALMLLPCRDAIRLAMEFIQHVFTSRADTRRFIEHSAGIFAQWDAGTAPNKALQLYCESILAALPFDIPTSRATQSARRGTNRNLASKNLFEAIRCVVRAAQVEAGEAIAGTSRHWQTTAQQHLRAVATACQNQALPKRTPIAATPPPTEIDWQIERTKSLLQRLLESGS